MTEIRFGTDGWRAVMSDQFTFGNVRRVCRAVAAYMSETGEAAQGVLVGRDARFMSEHFAAQAVGVFAEAGIPVHEMEGDAPTPLVAFAAARGGLAGAVMFTASHNPPEYQGVKFIPGYGGPAAPEITAGIEAHLASSSGEPFDTHAQVRAAKLDADADYEAHLLSLVDVATIRKAGLRVAYDAMAGSGRRNMPRLLASAGLTVESLHTERDPFFGGRTPEPNQEHLPELCQRVAAGAVDLGLATDGDADRFGVVDAGGEYLSANEVIVLLAYHLAKHRDERGALVRTVATTHMLDRLACRYGLELIETPVGFKHICAEMRRGPVVIGGEESGGLSIGRHIPEKDGLLAGLLVAELRAVAGRPLREVWQQIVAEIGGVVNRRVDLRVPDEAKGRILAKLADGSVAQVGRAAVREISTIDGVKLLLDDERWLLVRASGTEPLLRVYLEAPDAPRLAELERSALAQIEAYLKG